MLEPRRIKHLVRSATRAVFPALPALFALVLTFLFLPVTTPAFQNPPSSLRPSPTAPAAPHARNMGPLSGDSNACPCRESLAIPGKPVVAAWEWGKRVGKGADYFNERILHVGSPESRAYFGRLTECGITRLYLQVRVVGCRLACSESCLAGFISRAKQKGIEVYALFGKPSFARIRNHAKANAIVKAILRYNEGHPRASFAGIQSDIEPYYEFAGSGNTRHTDLKVMGPQYVAEIADQRELVDGYKQKMGRGLKLEAAIPFWYNRPPAHRIGRKPFTLLFHGFEGTITDQVIRLTDSVAVMSYRNHDTGVDGVSGVAHYVVDAVRRYNKEHNSHKKVIIGLETKEPGSRGVIPKITICRMTWQALWTNILKRLGQQYWEKPTVAGVAYNHTVSLFEMEKRWAGDRKSGPEMKGSSSSSKNGAPS